MSAGSTKVGISCLYAVAVFALCGGAFGRERGADISVTEQSGAIVVRLDVKPPSRSAVRVGGNEYLSISLPGEGRWMNRGLPAAPKICRSLVVPDDRKMAVELVDASFHEISGHLLPSKGHLPRTVDPADVPYEFDAFYGTDAWYPADVADLGEPYIMRDVRGAVLTVNPVAYNPLRDKIRIYTSITVKVKPVGPAEANARTRASRKPSRAFDQVYRTHFLNYPTDRYPAPGEAGNMLIVTHDAFNVNVQPLKTWKDSIGIPTTVVNMSTIGSDPRALKAYIQSAYNAGNLAFVLLVGDAAQVPTAIIDGGAVDPNYSLLEGDDWYADILVGRFSAETAAEVDTQVERTIEFERGDHMSADWFLKGTGVASTEGPGHHGEYDYEHMGYIGDDLLAYLYTHVDGIYGVSASAADVAAAVNAGRGIINYCGHGNTTGWTTSGFSVSDVNRLTNDNMLPFVVSVACLTGNFSSSTCFAEAWLRATNGGEPAGAVAVYAASINQSWVPPMDAQDEYIDRYCDETYDTFGALCIAGSGLMIDINGRAGFDEFLHWHIFGDPSLNLRPDLTPSSHVELDAPNGGEMLAAGSTYRVQWRVVTAHDTQNWDLFYSLTGAAGPWIPLAIDLPAGNTSTGSVHTFDWTVPDVITTMARVAVRQDNAGTDYFDISAADFTIRGAAAPNITANGSDGPVVIAQGTRLTVAASLAPGSLEGTHADWWLAVNAGPLGWMHYDVATGAWTADLAVTHQGPLFTFGPFPVLSVPSLPAGSYIFYFGVDTDVDGQVDFDLLDLDSVQVTVQ